MTTRPDRRIGDRLRRIRRQQGMSLADVEARSGGAWKAVVVGAYERGDRSVSVVRLAALAEFYGVPLAELLPGSRIEHPNGRRSGGIVLDLTALAADEAAPPAVAAVSRFAEQIRHTRGDHNGRVLSLRGNDVEMLALTLGAGPEQLVAELRDSGALLQDRR